MKRAGASALVVTQAQTREQIGIITEVDISHLVADGKNPDDVRIYQLMTARPTVVRPTTSIRDATKVMTSGRFRHLQVMGGPRLVRIVDITDICRARLDIPEAVGSHCLTGSHWPAASCCCCPQEPMPVVTRSGPQGGGM